MARVAEMLHTLELGEVQEQVPLRHHTSFRVGGPANVMVWPRDDAALERLVGWLSAIDAGPFFLLGRGSDVICRDGGFPGVVINTTQMKGTIDQRDDLVSASAGTNLSRLARESLRFGLRGLEFVAGIPGTVGGGCYMNAGAHGGEIKDVLFSARVVDMQGQVRELLREEEHFAYRLSPFRTQNLVVVRGTFRLQQGDAQEGSQLIRRLLAERNEKQPVNWPNAGSVFRNPADCSAGHLIELVGGKGRRQGQAQISERHANFIVNLGGALASDVIDLIEWAQDAVMARFGVRLEPEVQVIGQDI